MPRPDFTNKSDMIKEIIRVNHAGEYGAKRIYLGQLKFIKSSREALIIEHMLEQEIVHLDYFTQQLLERKIRPTCLIFFWHIVGYMLGAMSSLIGIEMAMILTKNIEEVIEKHYQSQINYLENLNIEQELIKMIQQFQLEEIEHKDVAITYKNNNMLFVPLLNEIIKSMCNIAIMLSKKI